MLSFKQFILLLEDRIDFLKTQFQGKLDTSHDPLAVHKDSNAIIDHFATHADPSHNKMYTNWILIQYQKADPQIWHHKHEWVGDNYQGFDIEKSKARSAAYKPIVDNIRDTTDHKIYNKIGTRSFWNRVVVPHIT